MISIQEYVIKFSNRNAKNLIVNRSESLIMSTSRFYRPKNAEKKLLQRKGNKHLQEEKTLQSREEKVAYLNGKHNLNNLELLCEQCKVAQVEEEVAVEKAAAIRHHLLINMMIEFHVLIAEESSLS